MASFRAFVPPQDRFKLCLVCFIYFFFKGFFQFIWISINRGSHSLTWFSLAQGDVQWLRGPNFAFFWPPPTYSGQTWTFEVPPTPCPRGQFQNLHPQPLKCNHQYAVHFYQNYKGINMVMACKIKLYYSKSDLKYMCLLASITMGCLWGQAVIKVSFGSSTPASEIQ